MKYLLILLLLAGACWGQTVTLPHEPAPGSGYVLDDSCGAVVWRPLRDTAYWYPAKIDTVKMERKCVEVPDMERMRPSKDPTVMNNLVYYFKDSCYWMLTCDTTWAKKEPPYLSPQDRTRLKMMLEWWWEHYGPETLNAGAIWKNLQLDTEWIMGQYR